MEKLPQSNEQEVLSIIRLLPAKSQAEMLQLMNGLRLVADCTISLGDENGDKIIEELEEKGFSIASHRNDNGIKSFYVSKNPDLLAEATTTENIDPRRYGELMGFPKTAIEAFVSGNDQLMDNKEQEKILGFLNVFFPVRLSKAHYQEEIEYLKNSYRLLLEQAPYIITDVIHKEDADEFLKSVTNFVNS